MSCSNTYSFILIVQFVVKYNLPFNMHITFKNYYFQAFFTIYLINKHHLCTPTTMDLDAPLHSNFKVKTPHFSAYISKMLWLSLHSNSLQILTPCCNWSWEFRGESICASEVQPIMPPTSIQTIELASHQP